MKFFFVYVPQLAKTFSGGSLLRACFQTVRLWYFLLTREIFSRGKELKFVFYYDAVPLTMYLSTRYDIIALLEVFVWNEYEWAAVGSPKVIFDLGAHFGDSALYYYVKYPDAIIYALEPSPDSYTRLLRNIESIPNIIPVQAALGETDGESDFTLTKSSLGSSLQARKNEEEKITVRTTTLKTLVQKAGRADLIKFDIEGGETALFASGHPSDFANAYIGEVHTDLISSDLDEFTKQFEGYHVATEVGRNPKRFMLRATRNV